MKSGISTASVRRFGMRVAHLVLLVIVIAACGGATSFGPPAGTPRPNVSAAPAQGPTDPPVPWADYAASVKTRIDGFASTKDCTSLQGEFDQADANNATTQSRTGHNNAQLMAYIDFKMRAAGCST